jgi:hypothetical protein
MVHLPLALCALALGAARAAEVGQWEVYETSFETQKTYAKPFADVEVNVVFRSGDRQWVVPAFWAGGGGLRPWPACTGGSPDLLHPITRPATKTGG